MIRRHPHLLAASFALWGLAIAISLYPFIVRPAPAGQTPGYATQQGIDARSSFRALAVVTILPIFLTTLCRPLTRRLTESTAWPWAANAAALAMLASLWLALINRDLVWSAFVPGSVVAVCTTLRRFDAAFSRRDAVLLPATLTVFLALHDIVPSLAIEKVFAAAAAIVLMLRLIVAAIPSPVLPAYAFLIAPLGLTLQTPFLARDQRHFGWTPLILAIVSPLVLRFFLRNATLAARLLKFVVYPIAVFSYSLAISLVMAEGKSRIDFFEAGHGLMPASEMLRGERPYRDILPGHGLIEDGLLDYLSLRFRGETAGDALKTRLVLSTLKSVALYALVAAATGSPDVASVAPMLTGMLGWYGSGIRDLPALVALTCLALAVRCRRASYFGGAMAMVAIAGFTSLDFAAYTFLAFLVALIRFPNRRRALLWAAIGAAAVGIPALVILLAYGIFGAFVRETFLELPEVDPAFYTVTVWRVPQEVGGNLAILDIAKAAFEARSLLFVVWFVALVFLAVTIARSPLRSRRRYEPLVILATFIVAAALSYVERQNLLFPIFCVALVVSGIFLLFRMRFTLAPVLVLVLMAAAGPTSHLAVAGWLRTQRGRPMEAALGEISNPSRARGALFRDTDRAFVASAKTYLDRMPPDETFFDFVNLPILYFLFDRDCPIRQYEVMFYQSEERQREVIARLEGNRKVTAAFVPLEAGQGAFDGVASWDRAPLVWRYLQENFEPAFQEGRVSIWRRKR